MDEVLGDPRPAHGLQGSHAECPQRWLGGGQRRGGIGPANLPARPSA